MEYICGVCGERLNRDLLGFKKHTEEHIVEIVKKDNPQWVEESGICPKCLEYYQKQLKGEDS